MMCRYSSGTPGPRSATEIASIDSCGLTARMAALSVTGRPGGENLSALSSRFSTTRPIMSQSMHTAGRSSAMDRLTSTSISCASGMISSTASRNTGSMRATTGSSTNSPCSSRERSSRLLIRLSSFLTALADFGRLVDDGAVGGRDLADQPHAAHHGLQRGAQFVDDHVGQVFAGLLKLLLLGDIPEHQQQPDKLLLVPIHRPDSTLDVALALPGARLRHDHVFAGGQDVAATPLFEQPLQLVLGIAQPLAEFAQLAGAA